MQKFWWHACAIEIVKPFRYLGGKAVKDIAVQLHCEHKLPHLHRLQAQTRAYQLHVPLARELVNDIGLFLVANNRVVVHVLFTVVSK